MGDLSPDEQARFERAAGLFSGEGEIRVTADSIRAFVEATSGIYESPAARLRRLAIRLEAEPLESGWEC